MPGFLLHVNMQAACPHLGRVSVVSSNTRVFVSTQPVATIADQSPIAGCTFTLPGPKPSPCLRVQWAAPATRVFVNGLPVLLQSSAPLSFCLSPEQAPQGTPAVTVTQTRVTGT